MNHSCMEIPDGALSDMVLKSVTAGRVTEFKSTLRHPLPPVETMGALFLDTTDTRPKEKK
jgi:hypothetical protein